MKTLLNFIHEEYGATAIEYALIGSLICIVIAVAVTSIGTNLPTIFNRVSAAL